MSVSSYYDFNIVGGGTSGLVVAARLSENLNQTVLVLEAGADNRDDHRATIPGYHPLIVGSDLDWGFQSQTQVSLSRDLALIQ